MLKSCSPLFLARHHVRSQCQRTARRNSRGNSNSSSSVPQSTRYLGSGRWCQRVLARRLLPSPLHRLSCPANPTLAAPSDCSDFSDRPHPHTHTPPLHPTPKQNLYGWQDPPLDQMDSSFALQQYLQRLIRQRPADVPALLALPPQQDDAVWQYEQLRYLLGNKEWGWEWWYLAGNDTLHSYVYLSVYISACLYLWLPPSRFLSLPGLLSPNPPSPALLALLRTFAYLPRPVTPPSLSLSRTHTHTPCHNSIFCLQLNDLVVLLQEECVPATCTEMKADEWLYLCAAHQTPQNVRRRCCCCFFWLTLSCRGISARPSTTLYTRWMAPQPC